MKKEGIVVIVRHSVLIFLEKWTKNSDILDNIVI